MASWRWWAVAGGRPKSTRLAFARVLPSLLSARQQVYLIGGPQYPARVFSQPSLMTAAKRPVKEHVSRYVGPRTEGA
jgi:hypothetical protein